MKTRRLRVARGVLRAGMGRAAWRAGAWGASVCCVALLGAWLAPAVAQEQKEQASVADAARRASEKKKQAPKASRVWTNDNLPSGGGKINIVGPENAPAAAAPAPPDAAAPTPAEREAARAETETALAAARELLMRVQREHDLLQRELNLQTQQYYSNPAFVSDKAGKARLDALNAQINAKREEMQQAQADVAALERKLESLKGTPEPKKPAESPESRSI